MITSHYLFRRISTASISKKKLKFIQRIAIIIHEMELMLPTGGCNSWDLNSQVFSEELTYFCTNSLRLLTVVLSIYITCLQTAGKSKDALGFSKTLCVWSFGNHQGFMHGLSGKKTLNLLRILTWNTTELMSIGENTNITRYPCH